MKKDVIYIDTEDDITSIIDKVKASEEKIIALVPPKRVGVLQSAVNLKLLQKSAKTSGKKIVLITGNKSLGALAAGVSIPIAKTLQSKPELAQANAMPDDKQGEEDVIEGEDLPVGELAKTSPAATDEDDESIELPEDLSQPSKTSKGPKKSKDKKSGQNIPDFDIFRKKLFLVAAGGVLLVIFLIWAFFFAPHATVNIKARTSTESVVQPVTLNSSSPSNVEENILQSSVQQTKKSFTADFQATGKKDVGEKATGTVTISNCSSPSSITIPAGTAVSSDGLNFLTSSAVTVPGGSAAGPFLPCTIPGKKSVSVQAQNVGENYNLASGSDFTVAGQGSGVSGTNQGAFTGGSKRTVTVVSDSDIETAKTKLVDENKDTGKTDLKKLFGSKYVVIDTSYKADPTNVTSSPPSGSEASSAKLSVEITYSLTGLDKDDVNAVLNSSLKEKMDDSKNQKIYDNGIGELKFENFSDNSVTLKTKGYIGPNIDEKKLKPQLVGKNYEEIRQIVMSIDDGVEDVVTNFSPFWVSKAPGEDKIDIKFVVKKDE